MLKAVSYTHLSEIDKIDIFVKDAKPAKINSMSVSYTHLDVYKRQGIHNCIS